MAGAPIGNQNAAKAKVWLAAINRALERRSAGDRVKALDECADRLVSAVLAGEQWAILELGNRLDGKPAQAIVGGGEGSDPIQAKVEVCWTAVDAGPAPTQKG